MAVYSRQTSSGSLPPSTNTSSLLPSQDLGSIIVRSLEESLQNMDDNSDNLIAQIREGINTSVLGKNNNSNPVKKEQELQKLKKKNEEEDDKRRRAALKKMSDDYEKTFKKFQSNLEGTFDKAFKGLSTFAENPLMGFDKGLQSVIKGALGTVDKIANTPIKFGKKENGDTNPEFGVVNSNMTQIQSVLTQIKSNTEKTVDKETKQEVNETKNERKRENERKEDKKEGVVKEKKRSAESEKINQGVTKTNLTLGTISNWIMTAGLTILGVMAAIPLIKTGIDYAVSFLREKLLHFINMIPTHFENAMLTLGTAVKNAILDLKIAFFPMIQKIGVSVIKLLNWDKDKEDKAVADFLGIGVEEYKHYEANKDVAEAYYNYQEYKSKMPGLESERTGTQRAMDTWLQQHGGMSEKEAEVMYRFDRDSEEAKQFNALRLKKVNLEKDISDLEKKKTKALTGQYVLEDGTVISGTEFLNPVQSPQLKQAVQTSSIIHGDVNKQRQIWEDEKTSNLESAAKQKEANLLSGQFNAFTKDMTYSRAVDAYNKGYFMTSYYGKGKAIPLTDDQKNLLGEWIKDGPTSGHFRELTTTEKNLGAEMPVLNSLGNLISTTSNAFIGTPLNVKPTSGVIDVGGSKVNVNDTRQGANNSLFVTNTTYSEAQKNLAGR